MKRIGILMLGFLFCFVLTAWPQAQPQTKPQIITFDPPGAGTGSGQGTIPQDINPTGTIVGYYEDASGVYHGFVRVPSGKITSLDPPNSVFTQAWSNNEWGAITGYYLDANDVFHGFLRDPEGRFTIFDAPGADLTPGDYNGTFPSNINLAGVLAGQYWDVDNLPHGFVRAPSGKITAFEAPNAGTGAYQGTYTCNATCVNLEGAITGQYVDASNMGHGFVRAPNGTITEFDGPGTNTFGYSINLAGAVAAVYIDINSATQSFVRNPDGTITLFAAPGAGTGSGQGTIALGINAAGVVVGTYVDTKGVYHGFVRAPNGQFTFFDVPGAGTGNGQGTLALTNNDEGAITGYYVDANNASHGFLRLP